MSAPGAGFDPRAMPQDAAAVAARMSDLLDAGARHHRVCALDRRGWLLSRMDARSRSIVDALDLVYPTSAVVAGLLRLKGWPGRRPIATAAVLDALLTRRAGGPPLRVFHFGERPGVGARVLASMAARCPAVEAVGSRAVLDELWGPENNQALFKISDARPDLLLVALPSPLQQEWIHAHAQLVPAGLVWGVGRGELLEG